MKNQEVYNELQKSGLVSTINNEGYFSHRRCDNCNGLPGIRYEVEGYLNLKEARGRGNLYQLELCEECYMNLFN